MTDNSTDLFSLASQIGLITVGGTGLGLGIARAFIAQGARVVITDRREEALVAAVAQLGPQADYRVHDVRQYGASKQWPRSSASQMPSPTPPPKPRNWGWFVPWLQSGRGRACASTP